MKVSDHLYVYPWTNQRENNCNSILIDGKVPLLVDPGHLHRVNELFTRIKADGFDPKKIKTVIATHSHPDHFEGTAAFSDPSVKIGLSRQEESFIEEVWRPAYLKQGIKMPDYRVDYYLQEGTLELGKHEFEVILAPGHSPGSLCLYWPRHRVLIPGDVVFYQGVGRFDLPGGKMEQLKESVEKLSRLHVELLIPGHGPALQGADKVRSNFEFIKKAYIGLS
jgi:glyoxylase-like metal-dependent hydrolase (beta-lactamase superfamily II)